MQEILQTRIGEVIESSTTTFSAQCYELYALPPLGTLIKTCEGDNGLYAVVCQARTEGIEPGRKPIARGKDEVSEEAIFKANPQLSKLLRSEFSALIVGHKATDRLHQFLPPRPARIHSFVYACSRDESLDFSNSCSFLTLLVNAKTETPADELIAAVLRLMSVAHEDAHGFLLKAGKELATLLSQDYVRLRTILERIKP